MKRIYPIIVSLWGALVVLISLRLSAAPIDVARAKTIAQKQLSGLNTPLRGEAELTLVYTSSGVVTRATPSQQDLYVFARNGGRENGYVVVAGDDLLPEVLGYSFESRFVTDSMPSQLSLWLQRCTEWVKEAREAGKPFIPSVLEQETTPIEPLLGTIGWDQVAPFNALTPKIGDQHAPVGCVATALAQIMRYTCWPRKGRGAIKYTSSEGQTYYQKFDAEYDWAHMPNQLTTKSPVVERRAVATLMRDVGMAVRMNYKLESSGAYTENALVGLRKYFRYGNQLQYRMQDFTPYHEWVLLCLNELKAKRPVYYAAAAVGSGHAFVCDGYDGHGRFHFNWGWSGLSNGYFYLTDLAPKAQNTGGGGRGAYVLGSQILIGFQPGDGGEQQRYVVCDEMKLPQFAQHVDEPLEVSLSVWNYDYVTLLMTPAIEVFNSEGVAVRRAYHRKGGARKFRKGFSRKINIDVSGLPDGVYTVRPAVYLPDKEEYAPAHAYQLERTPRQFRIDGERIIPIWNDTEVRLVVESQVRELHRNTPNELIFSVENQGAFPYRSHIAAIYASTPEVDQSVIAKADSLFEHSLSLEPGERREMRLVIDGPKNQQESYLHILYDEFGGAQSRISYQSLQSFPLTLKKAYTVGNYEAVHYRAWLHDRFAVYENGKPLKLRLRVRAPQNKGVLAGFAVAIFDENETPHLLCNPYVQLPLLLLKPGEERVLEISETFQLPLGGKYGLYLYETGSDGRVSYRFGLRFTFSVVGMPSVQALPVRDNRAYPEGPDEVVEENDDKEWLGVEERVLEGVRLFPNPVTGRFTLSLPEALVGESVRVAIYSLDGRLQYLTQTTSGELTVFTEGWRAGLYMARISVGASCKTLSFVVE